ncbi:MAG: hypothetical protein K8L91_21025 [Anaerolineae bacterium]|nr:hypothetical protein [Anaerolineae bacterium]
MPKENILLLEDLSHTCKIWFYEIGHGRMAIRLSHPHEKPLYVILLSVLYFSGPFYWTGSNFREETSEKCLETLHNKTDWRDVTNIYDHKLYIVGNEKHVEIIAGFISLDNQAPSEPSFRIPD